MAQALTREEDLSGVLDWAGRHLRPGWLLVVGHSVGGQILGLAESERIRDTLWREPRLAGTTGGENLRGRWHVFRSTI